MPFCSKTLRWQREVDSDSEEDILAPENDRFSPEPLSGLMLTARQASNRYYVESEDLMNLGFDYDEAEYPLEVVEEYRRYRDKLSRRFWAATKPKPPHPAQTPNRERKQQQADFDPAPPSSPEKKPKTRWQDTPQGAAAVARLHEEAEAEGEEERREREADEAEWRRIEEEEEAEEERRREEAEQEGGESGSEEDDDEEDAEDEEEEDWPDTDEEDRWSGPEETEEEAAARRAERKRRLTEMVLPLSYRTGASTRPAQGADDAVGETAFDAAMRRFRRQGQESPFLFGYTLPSQKDQSQAPSEPPQPSSSPPLPQLRTSLLPTITKTASYDQYLLHPRDLVGLTFENAPHPHNPHWTMKLYQRAEVERVAWEKWGSRAGLEAERARLANLEGKWEARAEEKRQHKLAAQAAASAFTKSPTSPPKRPRSEKAEREKLRQQSRTSYPRKAKQVKQRQQAPPTEGEQEQQQVGIEAAPLRLIAMRWTMEDGAVYV